MSDFKIQTATRQNIKPLIGVYGESGTGKTYSALLLARGFVGPDGEICMIDSESGRGSLYADVLPGGYKTLELVGPFSPDRYIAAIEHVEKSGAVIGIIDSASHEWEGLGGVTDMAATIAAEAAAKWNKEWNGVVEFGYWKRPKMDHAKFMLRMMQSSIPWIVCLRAKYKSRQIKGTKEMADDGLIEQRQVGKTIILKDKFTSPIQAEDFIFEMTMHFEVLQDHTINVTKVSHPALRACLPENYKGMIEIKHGELLAQWAAGGGNKPKPQTPLDPKASGRTDAVIHRNAVAKELWESVKHKFADVPAFEKHLIEEGVIADTEYLQGLGIEKLLEITRKMKP